MILGRGTRLSLLAFLCLFFVSLSPSFSRVRRVYIKLVGMSCTDKIINTGYQSCIDELLLANSIIITRSSAFRVAEEEQRSEFFPLYTMFRRHAR